jgi:predicted P-loop ATPase
MSKATRGETRGFRILDAQACRPRTPAGEEAPAMTPNISAPAGDATERFVINGIVFRRLTEAEIATLPPRKRRAPPTPKRVDAESFLSALDPAAERFTFQTFDDDPARRKERAEKNKERKKQGEPKLKDPFARVRHGSLGKLWNELVGLNRQRAGIFITVNETDRGGREEKNITRVRALFIDLDGAPLPSTFHAKPHIIVESSPGRWHVYWLVSDCELDKFEALQERLIDTYGSDKAIHDLPRVLRLPGFLHQKGEPFVTRLVQAHDHAAYTVEQFVAALPEEDKPKPEVKPEDNKNNGQGNAAGKKATTKTEPDRPFKGINTAALQNLDAWVPQLFPSADKSSKGWRVSSASLDRDLEEDISFTQDGIKDFGVHDMGDARKGKRTPIDVVMQWKPCEFKEAVLWLCGVLGLPDPFRWRGIHKDGSPVASMHNAMVAITMAGVECAHDLFHNKILIEYRGESVELQRVQGEITDGAIIALRKVLGDRFLTDFGDKAVRDAVVCLAGQHQFDPVRDMLDQAQAAWDGVARLDTMVSEYANCADTPLNRAIMRKTMIAAVRRARRPGCKFDSITVLESEEGWNKSTFWRVLAGDENFSDESILGKSGKEIQEHLSAIWIHESADLAGMRKAEVESVKAFASRQVDIARPAYGYFVKKQPRHAINVGTTNSSEYLQSQTGNRRFWPLKVLKPIDIEKLERDRLQLWGEAAKREADGESINLPQELWGKAADEQEKRRVKDPWEEILASIPKIVEEETGKYETAKTHKIIYRLGDKEFVAAADVLTLVLKIPTDRQDRHHSMRLADAMKHLGWERERAVVDGVQRRGFARVPLANVANQPELRLARKN